VALTIAALNDLKVMACDIQNAYHTADCREKIWTVAGPEFGSEAGNIFIIKKALYGLKSAGAAFRSLLADTLMDIGYKPTEADPDVWLRPAVKANGFEYYEMALCSSEGSGLYTYRLVVPVQFFFESRTLLYRGFSLYQVLVHLGIIVFTN
jgi:hypothetical protein